jgi:hypothetical protein
MCRLIACTLMDSPPGMLTMQLRDGEKSVSLDVSFIQIAWDGRFLLRPDNRMANGDKRATLRSAHKNQLVQPMVWRNGEGQLDDLASVWLIYIYQDWIKTSAIECRAKIVALERVQKFMDAKAVETAWISDRWTEFAKFLLDQGKPVQMDSIG